MSNQFKYTLCNSCSHWLENCIGENKSYCKSYCPDYCLSISNEIKIYEFDLKANNVDSIALIPGVLSIYDESKILIEWIACELSYVVLQITNEY